MPRVTPEHTAAQRKRILDAAAECFALNGFHATSMQDILTAAGLSAGAVYRYFPSKEAIIRALAQARLDTVQGGLPLGPAPKAADIIDLIIDSQGPIAPDGSPSLLVLQIWAESVRNPEVAEALQHATTSLNKAISEALPADSTAAWALMSLGMGTYLTKTVLRQDIPTSELVDELRRLLNAEQPLQQ
jgi:AcrR family transcriptional regulator